MKKRGGMNKLNPLLPLLTYYTSPQIQYELLPLRPPSTNQILLLTDSLPDNSPVVDEYNNGVAHLTIKFVKLAAGDTSTEDDAEINLSVECNQHARIYEAALKLRVQICPSILYCGRIDREYIEAFFKSWQDTSHPLLRLASKSKPAIIFMEYVEEAPIESIRLQQTAKFLLFLLAKIGYAHGDPHRGNYMKNPHFDEAILIDFEHATELPDEDLIEVRRIWDANVRVEDEQYVCGELTQQEKEFLKKTLMYGTRFKPDYTHYNWLKDDDFVLSPITLASFAGGRRKKRTKHRRKTKSSRRRLRINPFN